MVALKNGERTNGSFSTDTRFFVCLLLFPPLRRPIWPISWALSRNSGFFPPAEKGGGESRKAKAKAPPPLLFSLPLRLLFSPVRERPCPASDANLPNLWRFRRRDGKKKEEEREKGRVDPEQPSGKRYFLLYTFQRQFLMFLVEEERKMSISIFFFVFRSRRHRRDHFLRTRGTLARTL